MAAFLVRALPDLQPLDLGTPFDDVPPATPSTTRSASWRRQGSPRDATRRGRCFCPDDAGHQGADGRLPGEGAPRTAKPRPRLLFRRCSRQPHLLLPRSANWPRPGSPRAATRPGPSSAPRYPVTRGQMAAFLYRAPARPPLPPEHDDYHHCRTTTTTTPPGGQVAMKLVPVVTEGLEPTAIPHPRPGRLHQAVHRREGRGDSGGPQRRPAGRPLPRGCGITDSERGLLGLAFHPGYASNRRFFVAYTDTSGTIKVDEYLRSDNANFADEDSATPIISIPHPGQSNHNGGMLAFTPDGLLLIGTGDGGGGGDPDENAQDTNSLLGKMLRIDVDGATRMPSPTTTPSPTVRAGHPRCGCGVCATRGGSRWTPPRAGCSSGTSGRAPRGDRRHRTRGGSANLGWDIMEGTVCYEPPSGCNSVRAEAPRPRLWP